MHKTIAILVALLVAVPALAQVPRTISFQGVLTDPSGAFLPDGNHSLKLQLYDNVGATTPIWGETQNVVVLRGVFNVILGSSIPFPTSISFDRAYFLGVSVDGAAELQPRTALTSVPYALRAAMADGVAPGATGVVTSVNGLSGGVTLQGGGGTTVTQNGGQILISSSGGSGGNGIAGVQSTDGSIAIQNPNGPVANLAIADGGVTSAKIADRSITADDLANDAVITDRIANNTITPIKLNTAGATTGQVLTYNGSSVQWSTPSAGGLTLPYSGSGAVAGSLFSLENTAGANGSSVLQLKGRVNGLHVDSAGTAIYVRKAAIGMQMDTLRYGIGIRHGGEYGLKIDTARYGVWIRRSAEDGVLVENARYAVGALTAREVAFYADSVGHTGVNFRTVRYTALRADSTGGPLIVNNVTQSGLDLRKVTGTVIYADTTGNNGLHIVRAARNGVLIERAVANGVSATTTSGNANGVLGINTSASNGSSIFDGPAGVYGQMLPTNFAPAGTYSSGVRGANFGTGSGGYGVLGYHGGTGPAVYGTTYDGIGVYGITTTYVGVYAKASTSGNALIAQAPTGTPNTGNYNCAIFKNAAGNNVSRIDNTGKGFFNGGTQTSGADLAEAFAVDGDRDDYEPGDVLVISTASDRTVAKSSAAYSTAVVGVYATKPGMLLTERDAEADHSDMVPMGVVGVIPTKVTNEGGAIRRGDLLVTSSTTGHAMKAGDNPPTGTVIGKALENFDGTSGMIRVMVNVK